VDVERDHETLGELPRDELKIDHVVKTVGSG
jgi:hypothetical protein